MNVNFQTKYKGGKSATNEWYTPSEIIKSLGEFDLDPATCEKAIEINSSAKKYFTKQENGLLQPWTGRVWLNPPYPNPDIRDFMKKMAEHNNRIALVFNRCDSVWFHQYVFNSADSILFLSKRIRFINEDRKVGGSPGCGSVLVAYGKNNTEALSRCKLDGKLVFLHNAPIQLIEKSIFD
ncbi:MAG: phage N-6-adenine-methyltransferase [Tannerellaceae bacterium]|nr:phage N-6-adenine-methyltransferase [Tannerellaceae bacterium]